MGHIPPWVIIGLLAVGAAFAGKLTSGATKYVFVIAAFVLAWVGINVAVHDTSFIVCAYIGTFGFGIYALLKGRPLRLPHRRERAVHQDDEPYRLYGPHRWGKRE